jgi:hypothetical protein
VAEVYDAIVTANAMGEEYLQLAWFIKFTPRHYKLVGKFILMV